jgi:hypothetical protein
MLASDEALLKSDRITLTLWGSSEHLPKGHHAD